LSSAKGFYTVDQTTKEEISFDRVSKKDPPVKKKGKGGGQAGGSGTAKTEEQADAEAPVVDNNESNTVYDNVSIESTKDGYTMICKDEDGKVIYERVIGPETGEKIYKNYKKDDVNKYIKGFVKEMNRFKKKCKEIKIDDDILSIDPKLENQIDIISEVAQDSNASETITELKNKLQELKTEGHIVEPISFPYLDYLVPTYYVISTAEASSNLSRYDGIRFGYRSDHNNDIEST
jgi:hypothetical protein